MMMIILLLADKPTSIALVAEGEIYVLAQHASPVACADLAVLRGWGGWGLEGSVAHLWIYFIFIGGFNLFGFWGWKECNRNISQKSML